MRLLGSIRLRSDISPKIRGIGGLPRQSLDCLPTLSRRWWCSLSGHQGIYPGISLRHRVLHKTTLAVSGPQEGAVNAQKDPAPLGEDDGREENTEPEENFQAGDDDHRSVVVAFDKAPNGIGQRG